MEEFNVLSRRGGGVDEAILATKMKFNPQAQTVIFERFRVLTCPDRLSVERVELDLSPGTTINNSSTLPASNLHSKFLALAASLELLRNRPTFCGIRMGQGRRWEVIFESKEQCRAFAKQFRGRVSLDGEFFAEEENGAGFEIMTENDPEAILLIVGNSIFLKSNPQGKNNMPWVDLTQAEWRRGNSGKAIVVEVSDEETMHIEFRTRAARERFLGRLPRTTEKQAIRVFSGTWNVGNAAPPTSKELARSWIDLALPAEGKHKEIPGTGQGEEPAAHHPRFDLFAFGLQECSKKDDWTRALQGAVAIHLNGAEEEVCKIGMVAMREVILVVFCRSSLSFTVLGQDVRATGIANTIGNKGGVGIGIDLHEYGTVAIVSAHLSAFHGNVKRREQDHRSILKHLNLTGSNTARDMMDLQSATAQMDKPTGGDTQESDNVELFDRVVFMGDLNYRIDMGSSNTPEEFDKVESLVRGGRWSQLAPFDQLAIEMRKEKIFFGYQEVKPVGCFPPTYRMMKDQQGYSNKRDQNPSFTDRVLLRGDINGLTYGATHELIVRPDRTLTCSDHRPVFAALEWEEEEKSWKGQVFPFEGADHKEISIKFNNISFRPSAPPQSAPLSMTGASDRNLILDENLSRLPDLEEPRLPNGNVSATPVRRRLSGFATTLMRRTSSAPAAAPAANGTFLAEDDDLCGELEDLIAASLDFDVPNAAPPFVVDESFEFRVMTACATDYPSTCEIVGNNEFVRTFVTEDRLKGSFMRIGVYSRPRKLVGYARFRLPVTLGFEDEVVLEIPVASRGARVGDLALRLQLIQS